MEIVAINKEEAGMVAPLVASFRVTLKGFKGIKAQPDIISGQTEIEEYIDSGFPCFAAKENDKYIGYVVCRIDEPVVWVESIFVDENHRSRGVADALFKKAEEIAKGYGESTVYNYVHPNNDRMIAFLRKRDYTVLNLIEIRKPYNNEKLSTKINIGKNEFDY